MDNRHVKFGPKIPNHLGKNVRKSQGGIFLTHTVVVVVNSARCDSNSVIVLVVVVVANNARCDSNSVIVLVVIVIV